MSYDPSMMGRGTRYRIDGILMTARRGFVLRVDDGGEWALDVDGRALKFVGCRVEIEGVRSGYDLIDVDRIEKLTGRS